MSTIYDPFFTILRPSLPCLTQGVKLSNDGFWSLTQGSAGWRAPTTMARCNRWCDTSFVCPGRFHICRIRGLEDSRRSSTVSKGSRSFHREGVERVPRHVCVCRSPPLRMQISASHLLLSAPNATRLFGVLGQKLEECMSIKVGQLLDGPPQHRLFFLLILYGWRHLRLSFSSSGEPVVV